MRYVKMYNTVLYLETRLLMIWEVCLLLWCSCFPEQQTVLPTQSWSRLSCHSWLPSASSCVWWQHCLSAASLFPSLPFFYNPIVYSMLLHKLTNTIDLNLSGMSKKLLKVPFQIFLKFRFFFVFSRLQLKMAAVFSAVVYLFHILGSSVAKAFVGFCFLRKKPLKGNTICRNFYILSVHLSLILPQSGCPSPRTTVSVVRLSRLFCFFGKMNILIWKPIKDSWSVLREWLNKFLILSLFLSLTFLSDLHSLYFEPFPVSYSSLKSTHS